jgi:hypothetical protein
MYRCMDVDNDGVDLYIDRQIDIDIEIDRCMYPYLLII